MGICKGVARDVQKQAEMQNVKIPDAAIDAIADGTERLIAKILDEAYDVCQAGKRKVVTEEDIKSIVHKRGLKILYPLFDQ